MVSFPKTYIQMGLKQKYDIKSNDEKSNNNKIPQVMQITNHFHAQPTEFGATYGTNHMIAGTIVHFDN